MELSIFITFVYQMFLFFSNTGIIRVIYFLTENTQLRLVNKRFMSCDTKELDN